MTDVDTPRTGWPILRKLLWSAVIIAVLLFAGAYLWIAQRQAAPSPDDYASAFGGSFTMIDQNGRTVTDRTLAGKPYAIFFGFTRCPDVCPTTLNRMAQLRRQLGDRGSKFNIVFVSVDRGHDTREDIRNFLSMFDMPVIGLTGSDTQLARIVKAFHVYYEKVPVEGGDYTIDHTATVFLMDAKGRFAGTIDHHEDQRTALAKLRNLVGAQPVGGG